MSSLGLAIARRRQLQARCAVDRAVVSWRFGPWLHRVARPIDAAHRAYGWIAARPLIATGAAVGIVVLLRRRVSWRGLLRLAWRGIWVWRLARPLFAPVSAAGSRPVSS